MSESKVPEPIDSDTVRTLAVAVFGAMIAERWFEKDMLVENFVFYLDTITEAIASKILEIDSTEFDRMLKAKQARDDAAYRARLEGRK
jgi:hypothetical protein